MLRATEEIKQKLSVVDVIGEYVKLERAGNYFKARCPFHSEKTPSFHVSPERGTYYCFGCGAKGDIFDFVEQFEGQDFKGALTLLANRAGVTLSRNDTFDNLSDLYGVLAQATDFFQKKLFENDIAMAYLRTRGVSKETIETFRIGVAPDGWSALSEYLKKNGVSEKNIETVGLGKRGDKGTLYDRFRNRIIFPIADSSGRVIGFSGRTLDNKEIAKYINSPETPLYTKSKILYGFDKAKQSIKKKDYTIVVEGQFDLVLSHQSGLSNTVAVSGTAFTTDTSLESLSHLGVIKRLSSNIIFGFDSDSAGINAAWKATKAAFAIGMDVKILNLPEGKDPADMINENLEQYKDSIKFAKRAIPFFAERIKAELHTDRDIAKAIQERIVPLLQVIPSAVEQSVAIKEAAQATGMSEQAILKDVEAKTSQTEKSIPATQTSSVPKLSLEDKIFGLLFYKESKGESIQDSLLRLKEQLGGDIYEEAYSRAFAVKEELLYLTDILYTQHDTSERDYALFSTKLAFELIRKKLRDITDELSRIHESDTRYEILLKESHEYSQKLKALTNLDYGN